MRLFDNTELVIHGPGEDGKIRADFTPSADFPPFNGHFPKNPILPGIAHISLITEILNRTYGTVVFVLETVKRVKFLAPALPEKTLSVEVTPSPVENEDAVHVEAVIRSDGKKISVLKLHYRRTAA